ncbi:MAG: cation:proton antiporter [Synechococcaceae cyanobacterium]|nr:cation:proton antiporter [Synechococcaceae cyanobacterium]
MTQTLALSLTTFGALLLAAVLLDETAARLRIPGILLVLVLGGLTTNWHRIRPTLVPSLRLATLGTFLTAALLTLSMLALLPLLPLEPNGSARGLPAALFIGGMFCSTDASAVLALLRPLRDRLPAPLLHLIETESGLNDPVAVVVCSLALAMAGGGSADPDTMVVAVVRQFILGITVGFLGGSLAVQLLLSRRTILRSSLLSVASLSLLMVVAGGTELLGGSGLLAAYIAGLVIGNCEQLDQDLLGEAHAGFVKLAELSLFLCLGLVVDPVAVVRMLGFGLVVALLLLLLRAPVVHLLLWRSGFRRSEKALITLAGLRGAVPIAVAIQAAATSVSWGRAMPALALAVVLFGMLGPGFALVPVANRLGLTTPEPTGTP